MAETLSQSEVERRFGAPPTRRSTPRFAHTCVCGAHGFVALTRGYVTFFDPEYVDVVGQAEWQAQRSHSCFYATRAGQCGRVRKAFRLHRSIVDCPDELQVDHINGNGLDNRQCNLRICTAAENTKNRHRLTGASSYKGVYFHKGRKRWGASICVNRKVKWLGWHRSEAAAAAAYDKASKEYHGEFGRPNARLDTKKEDGE